MKVLYDHQMFSIQKYGGISRYFANLFHFLNKQDDVQAAASILYTRNHYMQNEKHPLPTFLGDWLLKKNKKIYKWNKRFSRRIIKKNDFDIFHPTYYSPYFLPYLQKPFVLTVHDMIYEIFPEFFLPGDEYIKQKRQLVEKADHIIAISESTRQDIQRIFKIPAEKISVVYHGFYDDVPGEDLTFTPPHSKFILFVGDRATYKNFHRFVQAIAPIFLEDESLHLICTGGGNFKVGELEILYRNGLINRATQISASDQQLKVLYKQALSFVFPSLYEGFGFPLLEAFNSDCPVACSNTSCFKEVGGDAVIYFDPYDVADMSAAIKELLMNKKLAAELVEKGKKQLSFFTIEKCVAETKQVYKNLLEIK